MTRIIVLIEDNAQNRYLASFLLERNGYTVVSAIDGPTALEVAADLTPMGILLDIQLPGMNGYDVARALRCLPHLKTVPIIALTSYAMAGDRELAMAAGCDGYIEKPIEAAVFVDQIEAILSPPPVRS